MIFSAFFVFELNEGSAGHETTSVFQFDKPKMTKSKHSESSREHPLVTTKHQATHLFNFVRNLWPHYANRSSLFLKFFPVQSSSVLLKTVFA